MSPTGRADGSTPQPAQPTPVPSTDAGVDATVDEFRVHTQWQGQQSCVITVAGEVDVATAPELRESIHQILEEGPPRLIIDLDQVTFLDSTGLGVLISAHQRMNEQSGGLLLVCHRPACLRVMGITGLTRVFAFAPSIEEALKASGSNTAHPPNSPQEQEE